MRSDKDVEAYLLKLDRRFSAVGDQPGTYLVRVSDDLPPVGIRVDPPLVVIRVHVGDLESEGNVALFRKLLELNAQALMHASYGLEGNSIVLSAAHELENLDFNEIAATLDEIELALAQQAPLLAGLNKKSA